jgi:hypothetical protein
MPALPLSLYAAVARLYREQQLHRAAASTFAAARLRLEAKLFRQPQCAVSSHEQLTHARDQRLFMSLPPPLAPLSFLSCMKNHKVSRLPLLLDVPHDASMHTQQLRPFTMQASDQD